MLGRGFLGAGLVVGLALAADAADDPAAWSVEAVTNAGTTYSGVLLWSPKVARLFDEGPRVDLTAHPASTRVDIQWFNGLSGTIGLRFRELRSLERVGALTTEELRERDSSHSTSSGEKWAKERARLARISEVRARKAAEAAEKAAAVAEEAAASLNDRMTEEERAWLEKFPPEQGWVPARKAALYHQSVILNNRPLTDDEREWLDHYNAWKPAYDLWLDAEQKKIAAEKAAAEAGALTSDADKASATARAPEATVDPDHPTPEEAAKLPPPIPADAPKPVGIPSDAPKPVPVPGSGG